MPDIPSAVEEVYVDINQGQYMAKWCGDSFCMYVTINSNKPQPSTIYSN